MSFLISNLVIIIILMYMLAYNSNNITFSILFLIYWWFFCSIAYMLYHAQYSFYIEPFIWITGCAAMVIIGHTAGRHIRFREKQPKTWSLSGIQLCRLLMIILILNLLYKAFTLMISGQLGMLFTPSGLLSILNSAEKVKASGNAVDGAGFVGKLIGVAFFFGCILYGFTYNIPEVGRSFALKLLFLAQVGLNVITSAGKFSIISFIVLFVSGLTTAALRDRTLKIKEINYSRMAIYIIAIGGVLFMLMNNRAGRNVGMSLLMAYGFGEIPSFNNWFINGPHENTYGVQCFYGIVSHLGQNIMFAEGYTNYPLSPVPPFVNTFTMFRAVISDFGIWGGLVLMLLIGFSAGKAYIELEDSGFANGVMTMLLGVLFIGFLMPLGYYLTLFLGYVAFVVFISAYYRKPLHASAKYYGENV